MSNAANSRNDDRCLHTTSDIVYLTDHRNNTGTNLQQKIELREDIYFGIDDPSVFLRRVSLSGRNAISDKYAPANGGIQKREVPSPVLVSSAAAGLPLCVAFLCPVELPKMGVSTSLLHLSSA